MKPLAIIGLALAAGAVQCAARKPAAVTPPVQPSPCLHIDDGPCLHIVPHYEPREETPVTPDPDEVRTIEV